MERFTHPTFTERFPMEYPVVAPAAWKATFRARRQRHGGVFPAGHPATPPVLAALNGREPRPACPTCDTAYTTGVAMALEEWHRKSCPEDMVTFVSRRMVSRLSDAQGMVEAAADGRLNRPVREMERCKKLAPLVSDVERRPVLELVLRSLHSADEPRGDGSTFPYGRIAARLDISPSEAFVVVEEVIAEARRLAPRFVEKHIDAHTAGLASAGRLDVPIGDDGVTRGDLVPAEPADEVDIERELLDSVLSDAAHLEAPADPALEATLRHVLGGRYDSTFVELAVGRARAATDVWADCVDAVERRQGDLLG